MAECSAVDRLLDQSRSRIERVDAADLAGRVADGALVVDLRPSQDRERDGAMPGAVVVERIHLEWRLDPTSEHCLPEATPDRAVILVCNEGYASSLAAWNLRLLGVDGATDLVGGFRAWRRRAAAHPSPDKEHLPWP